MATSDTCCTIVPYFKPHEVKYDEFKAMCPEFVALTQNEEKALYYGFSFTEDTIHCREGYADAEGLLAHINNVGELLSKALEIAEIVRLEVHGPAEELEKLKEPLKDLPVEYYTLKFGFRK
jgi:quinol monooxygenase YgiN